MRNKKGQFVKGHPSPKTMLGKKHPEETKLKISQSLKGRPTWNKGKTLSAEHIRKRTLAQSGENHYNWKGGIRSNPVAYQENIAGRKKPKKCELCGLGGRICFDHDHATGKFRGWLCNKCNAVLGLANDDIKLLEKMIKYLKKL